MNKFWLLYLFSCIALSCSKTGINTDYLNGYWEIDRVEKDGKLLKQYNFNAFIEYFQVENNEGFRMKLKPSFVGKFSGNLQKTYFSLEKTTPENIKIDYNKAELLDEELQKATATEIVISNSEGLTYYYKKYTPISLP